MVCSIIEEQYKMVTFVDENPTDSSVVQQDVFLNNLKDYTNCDIFLGVGSNLARANLYKQLRLLNANVGRCISENAIISSDAKIGAGPVICPGVVVMRGADLGNNVILNTSCNVDHDCIIGDHVHISPNATLCGTVAVGEGTHVGAGAIVIPNKKIGKWATIGAGAVVITDIPDKAVVVGNPAKIIKYNE